MFRVQLGKPASKALIAFCRIDRALNAFIECKTTSTRSCGQRPRSPKGETSVVRLLAFAVFMSLALPANAQVATPPIFVSPDGQKQFGPYTWVWRSKTFQPAQTAVTVNAICPAGDIVLGGNVVAAPLWRDIANSRPTPNFNGWRVRFYKEAQGGTFTVTVYASCAPIQ
jgi:hypothetical protein